MEDRAVGFYLAFMRRQDKPIHELPSFARYLNKVFDFRAATATSRIIKQEEPAECIRCGKPFGVKSSVERVVAKLEGKHWMYKDSKKRLDVIRMCEDCRVGAMAEEQFDPFGAPQRPRARKCRSRRSVRSRIARRW